MRTSILSGVFVPLILSLGCSVREADSRASSEEAEAKARAEAVRTEMEAVPKAFRSRDPFKTNEPAKSPETPADGSKS